MNWENEKNIPMMQDNYFFQQENISVQQPIILNNSNLNSRVKQTSYFHTQISEEQKKLESTLFVAYWPPEQELYKYSLIKNPSAKARDPYLRKITEQFQKVYPKIKTYYAGVLKKNKETLTIRCYSTRHSTIKLCHWKLIYRLNNETKLYQLKFYNNKHQHHCRVDFERRKNYLQKFSDLREVAKDLYSKKKQKISFSDLEKAVKNKNNSEYNNVVEGMKQLRQSGRYSKMCGLNQMILSQCSTLKEILKKQIDYLKNYFDYVAYLHNQEQKMKDSTKNKQNQDVILFINPLMKHLYKNYNRVLIIQRQKFPQKQLKQKFSIINFCGVSFNALNNCFGYTVILNENKNKLEIMIKMFFYIHKKYPKTIIVSHLEKQVIEIIKNIIQEKAQNEIYINLVQASISGQFYNAKFKEILPVKDNIFQTQQFIIKKLLSSKIQYKFMSFLCKYPQTLVQQNLDKGYDRFQGPFVGFSLNAGNTHYSSKRYHVTNSSALKQIFLILESKFRKINMNYFQKQTYSPQIEKYYSHIQSLQKLRYSLSRKPFTKLLKNISQSLSLTINTEHPDFFFFVSNRKYSFIVSKTFKKHPPLACQCKYFQKSGIPCPHILKVAIVNEINLVFCIDIYWIVNFAVVGLDEKNIKVQPQPKRGRPKQIDKCILNLQ